MKQKQKFFVTNDRIAEDGGAPIPLGGAASGNIAEAIRELHARNMREGTDIYWLVDAAGEGIRIAFPATGKRNWEDTSYFGNCQECGDAFAGPKRARLCAMCGKNAPRRAQGEKGVLQRLLQETDELSLEAAAEISRLRAELEHARSCARKTASVTWQNIYSAPEFTESGAEPRDHLIIAAHYQDPARKMVALGHFKDCEFILENGETLDYEWTPELWSEAPEGATLEPDLRSPTRDEAAGCPPGKAGPRRYLITYADDAVAPEHFDDEAAARARFGSLSQTFNVRFFAEEMHRPAEAGSRRGIYMASKAVAHGPRWQKLRESLPVISTWIDESAPDAKLDWPDLWARCLAEATSAEVLIVYMEPGETLKGAWVEVGAALAAGVPVIGVGIEDFSIAKSGKILNCASLEEAIETARGIMDGNALAAGLAGDDHV